MSENDRTETDEEDELDLEVNLVEPDEHLAEASPEVQQRIDALLTGNNGFRHAAEKVREFPHSPGVYLMKDTTGVVIYVGKAKNLRSRAGSYFLAAAAQEIRTADWVHEIDPQYTNLRAYRARLLARPTIARVINEARPFRKLFPLGAPDRD